MTREQVENWLNKNSSNVNIHQSADSNSVYFEFDDDKGENHILRLSDHELPATYHNREHRHDWDMRYSDSWSNFKEVLKKIIAEKKHVSEKIIITNEEIENIKSEMKNFGGDFDKVCRIYGISGTKKNMILRRI